MEIRKSIVVNSTPVRVAEEYSEVKEIHVLDIPKPYKKRNIGLEESKYEWLLYLDDDCIVDKEILNIFYKIDIELATESKINKIILPDCLNVHIFWVELL